MSPMAWLDPLLALLLLLPAAWLAYPATLGGQLEPELSATGWWVILQLAPALLLFVRKPRPALPLVTMYAAFVALCMLSLTLSKPSDTLSASRSVLIAIASLSALGAGSALGQQGRRVFSCGLLLVSLAFTLPALAGIVPRVQGALQNSGATSEAALLGALAAMAWWLALARPARISALLAIAAYGVFVAAAPVIAGALVFVSVVAVAWFVRRESRRELALALGIFVLAAGATLLLARLNSAKSEPAPPAGSTTTSAPESGHLGGIAVRLSIAPRALAMFGDHPWLGVAPGQFRASFPPYRAAAERGASNRAAGPGVESEVEHAHNDLLTTLAEVGLFGALIWVATLVWLVRCALGALQSTEIARVALAFALLGGVLNALLRAPLTFNPASASLFFACAGALIASDSASQSRSVTQRFLPLFGLALLALQVPRAWNFVRHGNALRLPDALDLPAALAACPDSPLALSLTARKLALDPARSEDARATWARVLALRPFNFEALVQAGVLAANARDVSAARAVWQRAVELAPERTSLIQNLLLLESRSGTDAGFESASLRATGQVPRAWSIEAGAKELLAGDERAATRLWSYAGVDWTKDSAQQLYDRSREHADEPSTLKMAWEMLAQLRWAREHAATADFGGSVRSYRQALRLGTAARSVRLELAAALCLQDKLDEARSEVERAQARAEDWVKLEPWAGDALLQAGLFAAH